MSEVSVGGPFGHSPAQQAPARAHVQSKSPKWMDSDVMLEAREILLKCMRGEVRRDTADVQRRAALDVLGGALDALSDEALLAEVKRRAGGS